MGLFHSCLKQTTKRIERRRDEGGIQRLTPDLTMEILSRLPIRSVLQVKLVCKLWLTITSDPIFSTLHLNQSSINHNAIVVTYPSRHILNNVQPQLYFSEQPSLSEENISLFTKKIDLSFITEIERLQFHVVGTCNGLLCLAIVNSLRKFYPKSIHILNPITGEHLQLPNFAITCGKFPYSSLNLGFGFDDCKNVFKLVVFFSCPNPGTLKMENAMQILTIGRDTKGRRQLDNIPNVDSLEKYFNAFLDGTLHLIGTNRDDCDHRTIVVSFHLGSEDLEVIQTPDSIALKNYNQFSRCFTLGVINNCLSFVYAANDHGFVEIWLRKIENGIFSWIKIFSIHGGEIKAPSFGQFGGNLVFLKHTKDGELLLQFYNCLLSYNANSNTSKISEIRHQSQEDISFTETFPFVGSLISIKSLLA